MATHSSILAWEILWTEEPGGLQYMGSQRVGHGLATWLKDLWKWLQLLEFQDLFHHCHQYLCALLWAVVVREFVVGSASSSFFKNKFWRSFLAPACSRSRSGNPEK